MTAYSILLIHEGLTSKHEVTCVHLLCTKWTCKKNVCKRTHQDEAHRSQCFKRPCCTAWECCALIAPYHTVNRERRVIPVRLWAGATGAHRAEIDACVKDPCCIAGQGRDGFDADILLSGISMSFSTSTYTSPKVCLSFCLESLPTSIQFLL